MPKKLLLFSHERHRLSTVSPRFDRRGHATRARLAIRFGLGFLIFICSKPSPIAIHLLCCPVRLCVCDPPTLRRLGLREMRRPRVVHFLNFLL